MNTQDQPRRPKRSLLLSLLFILALLMSLCFMLFFAQLALSGAKQEWLEASMATKLRADYRPDDWVKTRRFAPLRIEEVINEITEETVGGENSFLIPLKLVEPQANSPQFPPTHEWPSH